MKELWVEKYRPDTLKDYVVRDEAQRQQIQAWIKEGAIPHLLLSGAPGVGKSMLAKAAADLLPPLSPEEAMETAMIYSTSGSIDGINQKPPFRAPHHTSSIAGLIGGISCFGPILGSLVMTTCRLCNQAISAAAVQFQQTSNVDNFRGPRT